MRGADIPAARGLNGTTIRHDAIVHARGPWSSHFVRAAQIPFGLAGRKRGGGADESGSNE